MFLSTRNTVGAFALAVAGCGPVPPSMQTPDSGRMTFDTGTPDRMTPTTDRVLVIDQPRTDRPVTTTDVARDVVNTDSARVDVSDAGPTPLSLRVESPYARFNCEFPSDVFRAGTDAYVVCPRSITNPNKIFTINTTAATRPIAATLREDVANMMDGNRSIANVVSPINDRWTIISANNGFYVVSTTTTGMNAFTAFPSGNDNGGGAQVIGNRLYVTTANLDGTNYRIGHILVYNITPSSSTASGVVGSFVRAIPTPNVNPTGASTWNNRLVVVCSGAFSGSNRQASVIVYNPETSSIERTISLGNLTASVSGHIAIDGDQAVIGTASYSGGEGTFFIINLRTGEIQRSSIPGDTFHSSTQVISGIALINHFAFNGRDAEGNHTTAITLSDPTRRTSAALTIPAAGPSTLLGDSCMLVIGQNAGVRVCLGM